MRLIQNFKVEGQYTVGLFKERKGVYTVAYGADVKRGLDYDSAARELGLCLFHALNCAGKFDARA